MTNSTSIGARLPAEGFVRIGAIIKPHGVVGVSRSRWYAGIERGEFPKPHKLGHCSLWKVEDIRQLLNRIGSDHSLDPTLTGRRSKIF
jgi:prophage regulatory protein